MINQLAFICGHLLKYAVIMPKEQVAANLQLAYIMTSVHLCLTVLMA